MPHAAILVAATFYWTVQRSKQKAVGFAGLATLLIGRVRNCLPTASGNPHRNAQKSPSAVVTLYQVREGDEVEKCIPMRSYSVARP
jgi:hypothetical protein